MASCLSYDSNSRPTFVEVRTKLQHYVDEDYYVRLDDKYNSFDDLLEAEFRHHEELESIENNLEERGLVS